MSEINIPPSVLEAAARAYAVANDTPELWWRLYEEKSRAALLAGLNNWPGMRDSQHVSFNGRVENSIILPLPQEKQND